MATFKIEKTDRMIIKSDDQEEIEITRRAKFDSFNENILGLGKLESRSKQINALSVFFDLEGFTNFCKQIDPQLAVPEYLSEFLGWIFDEVRKSLVNKSYKEGYTLWSELPFQAKYLGDGILFLWDTDTMSENEINNVVVSMYDICQNYKAVFVPFISKRITAPPHRLRCGIARGAIYTVGNGNDFVGPCINVSARLQKLNSLGFCFSRRGINPGHMSEKYQQMFLTKSTDVRGVGSEELVCFEKNEFESLSKIDKDKFKDV